MTADRADGPDSEFLRRLRGLARAAVLAGAVGSVGLMLGTGQHPPLLLKVLFALWVLSPFFAIVGANLVSKHWSASTRAALYGVTIVITLCTLGIYGSVVAWPPAKTPTPIFVLVPPASWLLLAIVVPVAALLSRRRPPRTQD